MDQLYIGSVSPIRIITPSKNSHTLALGPCEGNHIALILTAIRAESPYTLVGGAFVLQPTVKLHYEVIDTYTCTGNAAVHIVQQPFTYRAAIATESISGLATNWAADWLASYDIYPTGNAMQPAFPDWPSTDVLENTRFWVGRKPLRRRVGVASPGKPLVIRSKSRRPIIFTWAEYTFSTFLTTGAVRNKGWRSVTKAITEVGQVCGVKDASNFSVAAPVPGSYQFSRRIKYTYSWSSGGNNVAPSVYGLLYEDTATGVSQSAPYPMAVVGIPSLKAFRKADGIGLVNPNDTMSYELRQEANINPVGDCAGDVVVPRVQVEP